jgi:hypothetical protein
MFEIRIHHRPSLDFDRSLEKVVRTKMTYNLQRILVFLLDMVYVACGALLIAYVLFFPEERSEPQKIEKRSEMDTIYVVLACSFPFIIRWNITERAKATGTLLKVMSSVPPISPTANNRSSRTEQG